MFRLLVGGLYNKVFKEVLQRARAFYSRVVQGSRSSDTSPEGL